MPQKISFGTALILGFLGHQFGMSVLQLGAIIVLVAVIATASYVQGLREGDKMGAGRIRRGEG